MPSTEGDAPVIIKAEWDDERAFANLMDDADSADQGNKDGASCYICLEGEPSDGESSDSGELMRGCACRGLNGYGHLSCLIESAKGDVSAKRWSVCPTCNSKFVGSLQEKLSEARVVHSRALGKFDAQAMINVAQGKEQRGDKAGAESTYRRVLAYYWTLLGSRAMDHPGQLTASISLAACLSDARGEFDEPEALFQEVLRSTKNSSNPELKRFETTARTNLGGLYCRSGEFQKALPLLEEALSDALKGDDAECLVHSWLSLGNCHSSLGNHQKAISASQQAYNVSRRKFGPTHPMTRSTESGLDNVKQWAAAGPELNQLARDVDSRNASDRAKGTIHNVVNQPELNGREVTMGSYLPSTDRYRVFIRAVKGKSNSDRKVIEAEVKASNIIFSPNARVLICGLVKARDKNGETGIVKRFVKKKGRYEVRLERKNTVISAKPENVRLV